MIWEALQKLPQRCQLSAATVAAAGRDQAVDVAAGCVRLSVAGHW